MSESEMLRLVSGSTSKRPLSAGEQAYCKIRLEILTFGLLPGEMLSEATLAQRFGLSIAAVRAALPRLRQDGLLVNRRRRGQMVRPVTLGDIEETYELRYLLEPAAAERAVKHLDAKTLQKLDRKIHGDAQSTDRTSELEAIFANREFHVTIADMSGNRQLANYLREVHDRVLRFQYLLRHSEIGRSTWRDSHDDIIAAFEASDPEMAAEAARVHVETGREFTMQAVMEFPEIRYLHLGRGQSGTKNDEEQSGGRDLPER